MSGAVLARDDRPAALELVGASLAASPVGQGGERAASAQRERHLRRGAAGHIAGVRASRHRPGPGRLRGDRTHAAQLLDIDRSTMRRKIREYEVESSG